VWEHKLLVTNLVYPTDQRECARNIQNELDSSSLEGWELVSVCDNKVYESIMLFFKRPKK